MLCLLLTIIVVLITKKNATYFKYYFRKDLKIALVFKIIFVICVFIIFTRFLYLMSNLINKLQLSYLKMIYVLYLLYNSGVTFLFRLAATSKIQLWASKFCFHCSFERHTAHRNSGNTSNVLEYRSRVADR